MPIEGNESKAKFESKIVPKKFVLENKFYSFDTFDTNIYHLFNYLIRVINLCV